MLNRCYTFMKCQALCNSPHCQSVEHLSWMGLFKEDGDHMLAKLPPKSKSAQLSVQEEHQQVRKKFLNMR